MHPVHWVLTENPFYPVQILTGLYFGWFLSRRFPHRSMLWVWILPLLLLAYSFLAGPVISPWASPLIRPESLRGKFGFYFGWGCRPRERCIDQLLLTMPFYASAAYSFGALLARNMSAKTRVISGGQNRVCFQVPINAVTGQVHLMRPGWIWFGDLQTEFLSPLVAFLRFVPSMPKLRNFGGVQRPQIVPRDGVAAFSCHQQPSLRFQHISIHSQAALV